MQQSNWGFSMAGEGKILSGSRIRVRFFRIECECAMGVTVNRTPFVCPVCAQPAVITEVCAAEVIIGETGVIEHFWVEPNDEQTPNKD